jgi:hypothetical protein
MQILALRNTAKKPSVLVVRNVPTVPTVQNVPVVDDVAGRGKGVGSLFKSLARVGQQFRGRYTMAPHSVRPRLRSRAMIEVVDRYITP